MILFSNHWMDLFDYTRLFLRFFWMVILINHFHIKEEWDKEIQYSCILLFLCVEVFSDMLTWVMIYEAKLSSWYSDSYGAPNLSNLFFHMIFLFYAKPFNVMLIPFNMMFFQMIFLWSNALYHDVSSQLANFDKFGTSLTINVPTMKNWFSKMNSL